MTRTEITGHIIEILTSQGHTFESSVAMTEQTLFREDLAMDSLDTVEFILEVEKFFNINVPDAEVEAILTIGHAADQVEKLLRK